MDNFFQRLSLSLANSCAEAFADQIHAHVAQGARDIRIGPWCGLAEPLLARLGAMGVDLRLGVEGLNRELPANCTPLPDAAEAQVIVRLETDGDALAQALMALVDLPRGHVVAARTVRHGLSMPLFLISIPKSGTHLLIELARGLGYADGMEHDGDVCPGAWYYLEYSNSHTAAPDFFVDTVRRSPFGNRHHRFLTSPALFIYRHPYDILVSEANYYHRPGKTSFGGYLRHLDFEQRLLRLIGDPWLMGTLRDRVGKFAAWLDVANVLPLSFEELVGAAGHSNPELQRRALWSVMLKLQIGGEVEHLARVIFNPHSATFETGVIGRHREVMTDAAWDAVGRLNPDYLQVFGYSGDRNGAPVSARIDEFRRRPLLLERPVNARVPILVEQDYKGWNLVRFEGRYYAFSLSEGPQDLSAMTAAELAAAPSAPVLRELRQHLDEREKAEWERKVVEQARSLAADHVAGLAGTLRQELHSQAAGHIAGLAETLRQELHSLATGHVASLAETLRQELHDLAAEHATALGRRLSADLVQTIDARIAEFLAELPAVIAETGYGALRSHGRSFGMFRGFRIFRTHDHWVAWRPNGAGAATIVAHSRLGLWLRLLRAKVTT